MKYQAEHANPPETASLQQVLFDEGKCRLALEEFRRLNVEGRFRKKLIDWGQFKKKHGVVSQTVAKCAGIMYTPETPRSKL